MSDVFFVPLQKLWNKKMEKDEIKHFTRFLKERDLYGKWKVQARRFVEKHPHLNVGGERKTYDSIVSLLTCLPVSWAVCNTTECTCNTVWFDLHFEWSAYLVGLRKLKSKKYEILWKQGENRQ